ncbi:MAG: flagellar assembly protein T N-terminal domain-containing protein [Candidatus Puniceispirillaceae bacterium]
MILDLYARLEKRSWLDLARLPLVLMLSIACFVLGATAGHAAGMRFTETTGRAVIVDSALEQQARMTALEDALYLAALEGGARIDGFSAVMTDSSLEDHFVIRPASRILDYTITNEVIDDLHYEVSIRAAVGDLPKGTCLHRRDVNVTVFAPRITHGEAAPAEAGPMAPQVITALVEAIEAHAGVNAVRATDTILDPQRLTRIVDKFDYRALTTGITRVRRGDFALVPEITLTGKRIGGVFDRRNEMKVAVQLHLFAGDTYAPIDHFAFEQRIITKKRTPFRTINVLNQPRRVDILDQMRAPVAGVVDALAAQLQCEPLVATMVVADGKLSVPIGSYHGMRENALAVASGTDTPWQIMRVSSVALMSSTLTPLNDRRDIAALAGRTVQFMEVPQ